ncbi:MAG: DNA gyrase subunit A, partial [Limisphaerales bacterium]
VKANDQGKIKIRKVTDNTAAEVEIHIELAAGISPDITIDALYAFTDCEVSLTSRIIVIRDNRPVELTVSEVLRANTDQLVALLKRELELRQSKLEEDLYFRTLERIFIEERIYMKI